MCYNSGMLTDGEPPLLAIVGPTATGKTAVGVALAHLIGGEIVSADAVAVYRGLNIGAAKPDRVEQDGVPFHLLDVADPDEDFTLADFEAQANRAIAGIRGRGRVPILVGGTGLYVRSVTATLTVPAVPPQPDFREALYAEADAQGPEALHARLAAVDPQSAAKIQSSDTRRIIRALEVWSVTGQPMSSFHTPEGVQGVGRPNTQIFGLRMERNALYQRIENRVDAMLDAGFLGEVQGLLDSGYGPELKAMQSLGYRHLTQVLRAGVPLGDAVAELKRDTRRFAKRQIAWFNADARVRWLDIMAQPKAGAVATQILSLVQEQN